MWRQAPTPNVHPQLTGFIHLFKDVLQVGGIQILQENMIVKKFVSFSWMIHNNMDEH